MSFAEMTTELQTFLTANWKIIFGALLGWLGKVKADRIREKEKAVYTRKLEDENRTLQASLIGQSTSIVFNLRLSSSLSWQFGASSLMFGELWLDFGHI
jgi:hypothetical protein